MRLTAHAGRSGGRSPGFWAEERAARAVKRKVVMSFMLRRLGGRLRSSFARKVEEKVRNETSDF